MKVCQAQLCADCRLNSGVITGVRADNPRVKYCKACSLLIRNRQSSKWKRARRSMIGWRAYQDEYSPYYSQDERRLYHRQYMRRWRVKRHVQDKIRKPD